MIFYLDSPWTRRSGLLDLPLLPLQVYVNYSNYENPTVNQMIESGLETLERQRCVATIYHEGPEDPDERSALGLHRLSEVHHGAQAAAQGLTYYTSNNLRFQDFTRV